MIVSFTEYVLWIVRMYAAAEMSMNSVERVSECMSPPFQQDNGLMIDLDLDVEEEEQDRGFEPPAHWPSRDSVVQVENLTCHYAPQARLHPSKQFTSLKLMFSLSLCYEGSHSRLVQRRRSEFVVVLDLGNLVSPHHLIGDAS